MKLGYAMYSARDLTIDPESMRMVLKEVAGMGYEGVEFFLYNDTPPETLKEMLEEFNLEAIGTHVHKPRWDADTLGEIEYAKKAGIPYLVYPWISPEMRNEEFYRNLPGTLKNLADQCRKEGIQLQYHNHDFEFVKFQDQMVMDYLMEAEDSITFELDTFWAQYAGIDVLQYMKKYGSRIPMIHIKDYLSVDNGQPSFTAIGTGKLDNSPIIKTAMELGQKWLIVELDNSPLNPLESARISIEAIKKMM